MCTVLRLYHCFWLVVLLNLHIDSVENILLTTSSETGQFERPRQQTTAKAKITDYLKSTVLNEKVIRESLQIRPRKNATTDKSIAEPDVLSTTDWFMIDSLVPMLIDDIFKKSNTAISSDSEADDHEETADVNMRAIRKSFANDGTTTASALLADVDDDEQSPSSSADDIGPVVPCDYADGNICWYNRQVGDSITLAINVTNQQDEFYAAQWTRIYGSITGRKSVRTKIDSEQSPWNAVVGSDGLELRLSPITNTDLDTNSFVAKLVSRTSLKNKKLFKPVKELTFRINVLPIDMGTISPGEDISINVENFVTVPVKGLTFEWGIERRPDTIDSLPSNMQISKSGKSVTIKDLKNGQGGVILVCIMYSNTELTVAKRRFLIQRPKQNQGIRTVLAYDIEQRDISRRHLESPDPKISSSNSSCFRSSKNGELSMSIQDNGAKARNERSSYEDYDRDEPYSKTDNPEEEGTLFGTIQKEVHIVEPTVKLITHEDSERSLHTEPQQKILYNCTSHYECGPKASCIYPKRDDEDDDEEKVLQGVCQCNPEYQGDGRRCHRPSNYHHRDKRIKRAIQPPYFDTRSNSAFMYAQGPPIPRQQQPFLPPPPPVFNQLPLNRINNQAYDLLDQAESLNDQSDSLTRDDEDTYVVTKCDSRDYCSPHATCVRNDGVPAHCKCIAGFRGNGIFCWEIPDYVEPVPNFMEREVEDSQNRI